MPRLNVIVTANTAISVTAVLWADVPASQQSHYANPSATSTWTGATSQDIANLQAGSVVEQVMTQGVSATTTLAQLESALQQAWTRYQNQINTASPWQFLVGGTWNGTTWTAGAVAV